MKSFKEFILEKENWLSYLKLIDIDPSKYKKLDPNEYKFFMNAYKKSSDASEFEQNYLDDLKSSAAKIAI